MAPSRLNARVAVHLLDSEPSSLAAITQAELTAGTSIRGVAGSEAITNASGWDASPSSDESEDWASLQVASTAGLESLGQATFEYRYDPDETTIWDAHTVDTDTAVWVVLGINGSAATERYEVYTCVVSQKKDLYNADGPSRYRIVYNLQARTEGIYAA